MRQVAALLFLSCSLLAAETAPPLVTVCDVITHLAEYDQKIVVVVGRLVATDEGAWLTEECGFKIKLVGREFNPSISLAYIVGEFRPPPALPQDFEWNRHSINQKLEEVKKTTRLNPKYKEHWYAYFGRLETHLPYHANLAERTVDLDGFGHLSGSPAQLIAPQKGYLKLK